MDAADNLQRSGGLMNSMEELEVHVERLRAANHVRLWVLTGPGKVIKSTGWRRDKVSVVFADSGKVLVEKENHFIENAAQSANRDLRLACQWNKLNYVP